MEVTYEKILGGYILNTGDTLCLHGVEYKVEPQGSTYFLDNRSRGLNNKVFEILGIKDKVEYCEKILGIKTYGGDFPEVETLSDLTAVVKALYERSPYKVGDKVKLKDDVHGCPWVIGTMEKDVGKVVTIKDITLSPLSEILDGDPHQYRFKEITCIWPPQVIDHKVEDAEVAEDTNDEVCGPVVESTIKHDDDSHCGCAFSSDIDMKSSMDCYLVEEPIIIQKPKSKIKTTIKL